MGSEGSDPLVPLLVGRNSGFVFEDISDFVQAFEDACLREGIDRKFYGRALFNYECLRSEVDSYEYSGFQQGVSARIDHHWEESVLQAILPEDVGEACGDDRFEAEIFKCPDSVFSRATATEVIAGDKNLG